MALFFAEFAAPGTATNLTTALGLTSHLRAAEIVIKNISTAANAIYVGGSGVTTSANRGHELLAGNVLTLQHTSINSMSTAELYLIGTVAGANKILITVVT